MSGKPCGAKPVATREVTAAPPNEPPRPTFKARTIGPEPSGASPIEEEDLEGLYLADLREADPDKYN